MHLSSLTTAHSHIYHSHSHALQSYLLFQRFHGSYFYKITCPTLILHCRDNQRVIALQTSSKLSFCIHTFIEHFMFLLSSARIAKYQNLESQILRLPCSPAHYPTILSIIQSVGEVVINDWCIRKYIQWQCRFFCQWKQLKNDTKTVRKRRFLKRHCRFSKHLIILPMKIQQKLPFKR